MSVDIDDVEAIARLARIQIDPESLPEFVDDLSRILELVEHMSAADTGKTEPMASPHDLVARLRTDEITEQNQRDRYQGVAPATEAGLFLVPKVIE